MKNHLAPREPIIRRVTVGLSITPDLLVQFDSTVPAGRSRSSAINELIQKHLGLDTNLETTTYKD